MRKLGLLLIALLIPFAAGASLNTPKDNKGYTVPTIDLVGAEAGLITNANGTNSLIISSGSLIVYGFTASNAAIGDYITLRSTNITGVSVATKTVVYVSTMSYGSSSASAGTNSTYWFKFPVPLKFTDGLNAKLSATVSNPGSWTIYYRKASATE